MKKIRLRLDILLQEAGINRLTLRICLALGCDIKDLLEIVDE